MRKEECRPEKAGTPAPPSPLISIPLSFGPVPSAAEGAAGTGRHLDGEIWKAILANLERQLGADVMASWFCRIDLISIDEIEIQLSAPQSMFNNRSPIDLNCRSFALFGLSKGGEVSRLKINLRNTSGDANMSAPTLPSCRHPPGLRSFEPSGHLDRFGLPHTKSGNQMQKAQWLLIDTRPPGGQISASTKALHRLWAARGIPQNSETFFSLGGGYDDDRKHRSERLRRRELAA